MRVEYTLGEQQTIRLVPRMIKVERFESLILSQIENEWLREKLVSFYTKKDPSDPSLTERGILEMQSKFPITMEMAAHAEGQLAAGGALDVGEVHKNALRRLGTEIAGGGGVLGDTDLGLEHQVELADGGKVVLAAVGADHVLVACDESVGLQF